MSDIEGQEHANRRGSGTGPARTDRHVLSLYVTGMTPRSIRAIENVRGACEQYLNGRYELEVIDVYQEPSRAAREQILAVPTLVKTLPLPLRRIIGDMSNRSQLLAGLDISERPL